MERQESKTAVKLQRFTLAKDGETIFVNDMTKVSSPYSLEYNFQYQDIDYPVFDSVIAVVENAVDMEKISCCAKVVFKGNQVEGIGASKLLKVDCYIADETCLLKLTLWKDTSTWYPLEKFTHSNILEYGSDGEENERILNTTLHPIQTVITQAENLSEEQRCAINDVEIKLMAKTINIWN